MLPVEASETELPEEKGGMDLKQKSFQHEDKYLLFFPLLNQGN